MTSSAGRAPVDVPGLLRALLADDPGRPRLTWYGPAAERIELSAKVLDNWVAKTANLLVDELDAGPGTRVAVLLPAHWRTVVWLLAGWSVGAHVLVPAPAGSGGSGPPPSADIVVGAVAAELDEATAGPGAPQPVAVALGALAVSFGPGLPDGAVDAASEVRRYGDVFVPPVRPAPSDAALTVDADPPLTHGVLLDAARAAAQSWPDRVRLLTGAGPERAVQAWLAPLVRLGSLVLHHERAELAGLAAQEGVTATLS